MHIILDSEGALQPLVDAGLKLRSFGDEDDVRALFIPEATAQGKPGFMLAAVDPATQELIVVQMTLRTFFGIAAAMKGRCEFLGLDLEDLGFIWKDR